MKTRMLSETQRGVIVGLRISGMSIHRIVATLGMAQSTIFTLLKNFHDCGTLQPLWIHGCNLRGLPLDFNYSSQIQQA